MKVVNPDTLPHARGYNNGIISGNFVFVAGQIGWDRTGKLAEGLPAQFERALANVISILHAAGSTAEKIVRFTIFIKDKEDYLNNQKRIGEAYRKKMGKHFPVMSLVIVKDLLEPGALVEIEATAGLE